MSRNKIEIIEDNKEVFYSVIDEKEEKKHKKKKLHWFTILMLVVDFCAVCCFGIFYGPYSGFRDWFVATAMSSGKHKYFAYTFYSDETVKNSLDANAIVLEADISDVSSIEFIDTSTITHYANEYEEQILKKDEGNDLYKIIELKEKNYSGFITVIYDPTRLNYYISPSKWGIHVSKTVVQTGAILGINCGGFNADDEFRKLPYGNMINNGKIYHSTGKVSTMIGMNSDGVLMLMNATAKEALAAGMQWGVTFGPYLVVNGEAATFKGNGGFGSRPRTAIAQRKDGILLLVTIDGGNGSAGITMPALTDLLVRYGAYNAANLDGGGSTILCVGNKTMNTPMGWDYTGERSVLDCLLLK